tara:strand:+ start:660 stop:827 length:168 start_codon:yes stop_codon:yes gene_type:complete
MTIAYIKARLEQIDILFQNATLEQLEDSFMGDSFIYELQLEQTHLINTLGGTTWI